MLTRLPSRPPSKIIRPNEDGIPGPARPGAQHGIAEPRLDRALRVHDVLSFAGTTDRIGVSYLLFLERHLSGTGQ